MAHNENEKRTSSHSLVTASEFDLEIGLRERLAQTLEARIAWAVLLKEYLQNGQSQLSTPAAFKYAAFDALKALDKPSQILLEHETPVPVNQSLPAGLRTARLVHRPKAITSRNSKNSFLYIRSANFNASSRPQEPECNVYLLQCPICSRTSFSSLQGLLNHARISHTLEWGTHEECVRACAVASLGIDIEAGIEVGLGPTGILPGLRTIFQLAVGTPSLDIDYNRDRLIPERLSKDESSSRHLTRTLGLHEDTPALAPFLGKEQIRRDIKVFSQDKIVDIDISGPSKLEKPRNKWRVPFSQRGVAPNPGKDRPSELPIDDPCSMISSTCDVCDNMDSDVVLVKPGTLSSRFHFTTRVIITDRSLWVDPANRPSNKKDFTHKWMITVEAPSYAHKIAAVLKSLKILTPAGASSVSCLRPVCDHPPFIVVGAASHPFLAKVELVFNEIEGSQSREGQPVGLEHWVDLDPLKSPATVIGEEQICDVELDKNTAINHDAVDGFTTINYKAFWTLADENTLDHIQRGEHQESGNRGYQEYLNELLPRFPLTSQDWKRRAGTDTVPYKLAASEVQLAELVDGRRKAIELGRARAIRDAYNDMVKANTSKLPLLSTGDVYFWLREEVSTTCSRSEAEPTSSTQLARSRSSQTESKVGNFSRCTFCGLDIAVHRPFLKGGEEGPQSISSENLTLPGGSICPIFVRETHILNLSPLNVDKMKLVIPPPPDADSSTRHTHLGAKETLASADPHTLLAIRHLIHQLKLPTFGATLNANSLYPLDNLGRTPHEVEVNLAPYSLLAIILPLFVRRLVSSGLAVVKHQKAAALTLYEHSGTGHDSLLLPSHIFTGMKRRASGNPYGIENTILLCLSSLGTAFASPPLPSDHSHSGLIVTKREEL